MKVVWLVQFSCLCIVVISTVLMESCSEEPISIKESHQEINADIMGSETEVNLVKELVKSSQIDTLQGCVISGGGSKEGLEKLIKRDALMANSSVRISSDQRAKLKENGKNGLIEIIFAGDAVGVITNSKLGVDSLSVFQLKGIFRGEIVNWKEVGGPDLVIHPYRRDVNSGTNEFFWSKIVQGAYSEQVTEVADNEQMLASIENDLSGIGYLGIGTLKDESGKPSDKVWAVNIYIEGDKARSPYSFMDVSSGAYYLTRPLYQYFLIEEKSLFEEFVNFELSESGQQLIVEKGFFPITEEQATLNQFYLEKLKM